MAKATKKNDKFMEVAPPASHKIVAEFTGITKKRYEQLLDARSMVEGQIRFHAEDALDRNNADKRGVPTHMADVAGDSSRHEMELRMLSEDGNVLDLIDDAIERLIDGTYGKCQDCGENIPEARLDIRPHAIFCVKCKSIREKRGY